MSDYEFARIDERQFDAGGGSRTLTPPWGQLILSQPRIANFATPARRRILARQRAYAPGVRVFSG